MAHDKKDGKKWSTRDRRDLADVLARGESIEETAKFLLRPVGEEVRTAAELRLLADGGKYSLGKRIDATVGRLVLSTGPSDHCERKVPCIADIDDRQQQQSHGERVESKVLFQMDR